MVRFIQERSGNGDTLDWVDGHYKQGMSTYDATTSFKVYGITYYIEIMDMFGTNYIAKWWDNSDNGVGYNNQGWVIVNNQFNRMTGMFSPENIDDYITIVSDYDRMPPRGVQKRILDKVKQYIDYDALNDVKRSNRVESFCASNRLHESDYSETDEFTLIKEMNHWIKDLKEFFVDDSKAQKAIADYFYYDDGAHQEDFKELQAVVKALHKLWLKLDAITEDAEEKEYSGKKESIARRSRAVRRNIRNGR